MPMKFLTQILETKKTEITQINDLDKSISKLPTRDFFKALKQTTDSANSTPNLIAEVKKASPSKGVIRADFNPIAIAKDFETKGASAISVLTDEKYFQGKLEYLSVIKQAVNIPVLRKDFIISEKQIKQSAQAGADAILLIVRALLQISDNKADRAMLMLSHFIDVAQGLGLQCLVEVHNKQELQIAVTAGAKIIGINNRNLDTFELDLSTTSNLLELLPKEWRKQNCVVSESGMFSKEDFPVGVDAVLIGEGLAKNPDFLSFRRTQ